ncbi:MAG: Mur ligase [Betaproteobacteria bacterium]|nr:Mur ligase [Betaproteobacteria bacterium]
MSHSTAPVTLTEPNPCFDDSRRLTGPNRFYSGTAAILTPLGAQADNPDAHRRWREAVIALCAALGWPDPQPIVQRHAGGTLLVMAAPEDQLFTATEINEWAWEQVHFSQPVAGGDNPPFDRLHPGSKGAEVPHFVARAAAELHPERQTLLAAARSRGLPVFVDDEAISIGAGWGSRTWPLTALPQPASVPWAQLHDIPKALVTGANGKTTTVRLLAAMLAATLATSQGSVGYCSTEGVVVGGQPVDSGDYSGPAGARLVLRHPEVRAAVLETARGGILRRGLAVESADVAVVTNISADHLGEYGIDSLDDLAEVKLVVARALGVSGTLVLNADDPLLLARVARQSGRVALFAADDAHPALVSLRAAGGATCAVADGQLWLSHQGVRTALGGVTAMPLTLGGAASYNLANIAAAALAAAALGVAPASIAGVLARFGQRRGDNPGRLERWTLGGITVLVDYAHNPDGLGRLLAVAAAVCQQSNGAGRIGLLLGQAGNRSDEAIADLAQVAAAAKPAVVVLKEIVSMLRGRAIGEVPGLLKAGLQAAGFPEDRIHVEPDEVEAARQLLRWAKAGDVLVLPVHQGASRQQLTALLDSLQAVNWQAGVPLPPAQGGNDD